MFESNTCPECGVPEYITKEHLWLDNGDIVQVRDQRHRLCLIDCENLDPLFRGIEELIGMPIEPIVVTAARRVLQSYLKQFVPKEVAERVKRRELDINDLDEGFRSLARPMGLGDYQFVDMRFEQDNNDYFTVSITEPFSVPMCAGGHAAAMETILGYDHDVTYEQVAPDKYNMTAYPSIHQRGFKGRLKVDYYDREEGDIELEKCATCGGPKALSVFKWHLDRGVIVNEAVGRRTVVQGPQELDPIFRELEEELGETVTNVAVEAQRNFTKTGFYSMGDVSTVEEFRDVLAVRGLGNLKELKISRRGLRMRLDNAVLPIIIVGMMQGVFDAALDLDSTVDWELSEEGSLNIEVTPRRTA
jgi:hypothetical protein